MSNLVQNQPYDETLEVSDGEETATPRAVGGTEAHDGGGEYGQQHPAAGGAGGTGEMGYVEEDDESQEDQSESEESEEAEDGPHVPLSGAYDPSEYEHLQVSKELKELFQHIRRYTPQTIELDTKLKPFIPEYIPAVGDIDAFLKTTLPDGKSETLGLNVLDEPWTKQSDPTVLDLQLRTLAKQTTIKPMTVHNIANPEAQVKEMDNWIDNISELHRQKPATNVHYTKNMPDIEQLMQEWPGGFEEALKDLDLPNADLNCDLAQFTDIICGE